MSAMSQIKIAHAIYSRRLTKTCLHSCSKTTTRKYSSGSQITSCKEFRLDYTEKVMEESRKLSETQVV